MDVTTKIALIIVLAGIGVLATTGFIVISPALAQSTISNATSGGNATDMSGRTAEVGRL